MSLEELEKRIQNLEDVEEIKQLHIKYILGLNEQDFESMIECFAEDIYEEGILRGQIHDGKAALGAMLRQMAADQKAERLWKGGQLLLHPIIKVNGDTATGIWTWFRLGMPHTFTSQMGREVELFEPWQARYDMEYRRVNGKWKMSRIKFTLPWPADQWPKSPDSEIK
ncbi:nuclear transport factor 2 family protein [Chloroflexota bacterium]